MRKILYILAGLALLYVIFIAVAPGIVENQHNHTTLAAPYSPGKEAMDLYNSLEFVADLHSDALLWDRDLLKSSSRGHVDIPRLKQSHTALQVFTIVSKTPKNQNYNQNKADTDNITLLQIAQGNPLGTWFSLYSRARYQAQRLRDFAERSDSTFFVITNAQELRDYIARRKDNPEISAGLLGVEGAHMLEGERENLQGAFEAGIRILAPVHFFDNELGGSAHGVTKGGLTEFGREVIREAVSMGMIIDLSHGSPALIEDILNLSTRPVIVTHTGVRGTCDNDRNLSDSQLRKIAENGGLVGIAFFEQAVCGTDAAATARAIRHAADVAGVNHVALGSDFDGAVTAHFDITGLPLITEALINEGFTKTEINAIMGGNARDFFLKNLP